MFANMFARMPNILSLLLVLGVAASAVATTVNKCCAHGEILVPSTLACRPVSAPREKEASWTPVVFSPSKRNFLVSVPAEWLIAAPKRPSSCRRPTLHRADPSAPSFVLFSNGSLVLPVSSDGLLHPDNFCLDAAREPSQSADMELAALVCTAEDIAMSKDAEDEDTPPASSSVSMAVVRKCCGDGAAFDETTRACVVATSQATSTWSAPPPIKTLAGFPSCGGDDYVLMQQAENEDIKVSPEDGSLNTSSGVIPAEKFCVEHIVNGSKGAVPSAPRILACSSAIPSPPDPVVLDQRDLRYKLYPIALIISVIFLAATLAAGCLLPKTHHALHWRCQTGHVASLLVAYILLAATQIAGTSVKRGPCIALGVFMHYFSLAAFFWLNTMCFNIWWTFRDLRPASLDKGQELCRFRGYSLYAWGAPLLIAGIGLTLDLAAAGDLSGPLRPRFGDRRCWFYGDMEIFAYFHGPVGVLLLINLILFLATARELTCGLWRREVAKSSPHADGADRATLGRVCLKLVVVMGVTWVADVISWAVGGPSHAWYITDLINAFQGVFIFVVVGCQPQVWAALRRMWCFRKVGGNGGLRRRELGNGVAHDDDDDYDESGAVGQFCRGGMGGGVTSSGRPVSTTTSEAGPFGSSPPHSLTWEGDINHSQNGNQKNIITGTKSNEKIVEDKETLC
ncbi:probable G-protein coupled receptor Mth-like 1 [Ischnura elegans]|uniref:probable G-protein coupled receptor Mth-like 1 n=1 Tax=Ischnura elegans TaxID=197161 RepID=UPI001ED88D52|nr:probable G-protein coupled receptor Mth-like 1 [Ischnura elegans]